MPPSIPAAPWRSLSSTARLPSTTTTSTATASLLRSFSTTATRQEIVIPPASPKYIPLPNLPQSNEDKRPVVRGHLPVPREIFTRRTNAAHKLQPTFVEDTLPRSKREQAGLPPKSDKDTWKRTMADSRREALQSGITSLWQRKHRRELRAKTRADAKKAQYLADLQRPDRLDDVYTRGTVTQATLNAAVIRDPEYETKQLASQQRTVARMQAQSEARKDAVQRLYVEAGRFILTEQELADKVEKLFSPNYFVKLGKDNSKVWWGAANIWEASGRPLKMSEMFGHTTDAGQRTTQYNKSGARKTEQRQKIVASELTGGAFAVSARIDVDSVPTTEPESETKI